MTFHNPLVLFLIAPVVAAFVFAHRRRKVASLRYSSGSLLRGVQPTVKTRMEKSSVSLRVVSTCLVVFALARPQIPIGDARIQSEGIDIVLALDVSTSMLAEDFKIGGKRQNRIEIVKRVVEEFIKARTNDRLGVVAFGARPYTVSPLTLDHAWVLQNLERISAGMVEDGTAIGSGIAASVNRLRNTKARSKVIILLTDGRNNTGDMSPLTAAEAASALKVKIYTVGCGSKGLVPYPVTDFFGNRVYQNIAIDIDEETLTRIAELTGGNYFRATDTDSLRRIYEEIDRLEKTPVDERGYQEYRESFLFFLIPALFIFLVEVILSHTLLRRIP